MGLGGGWGSCHGGSVHSLGHLGDLCNIWSVIRVRTDAGGN